MGMAQSISSEPFVSGVDFKYSFTIGTGVSHFILNDVKDVSTLGINLKHPTPWGAFRKSADAAIRYLKRTGHEVIPGFHKFGRPY